MDFRPLETEHEFVQGDVRNVDDAKMAVAGVDVIVHAAALHGIHLRRWAPQDFWAVNASGTFNLFEAAREAAVARFLFCSTISVYGEGARPLDDSWNIMTEALPALPSDIYGQSKQICEQMGQYYSRRWGITTVALRLGAFVPESWEGYGFRLLVGGVDDRDVAQAVLLGLAYEPPARFDYFNIVADVPFRSSDLKLLQADPTPVLEHYWPGSKETFAALNLPELISGRTVWPPDKAKRLLGYRPRYNFTEFLAAYRTGNTAHYPFANAPWWGV
jgi:nucleoside-diphosphate-sugar epimerase